MSKILAPFMPYIMGALVISVIGGFSYVTHLQNKVERLEKSKVVAEIALQSCNAKVIKVSEEQKGDSNVDTIGSTLDGIRKLGSEWMQR